MAQVKGLLKLKEMKMEGFADIFNYFLEYLVFFRWVYFKNRPRGNLLFFRSILVVGFWGTLYFTFFSNFHLVIEGIDVDPVIALAAAVVLGYWNMTKVFHNKSMTCTQLHAEVIKAYAEGSSKTGDVLSCSLALHLLTMDMWAHRTYGSTFSKNLQNALAHKYTKNGNLDQALYETEVNRLNNGQFRTREARQVLENYLDQLITESARLKGTRAA